MPLTSSPAGPFDPDVAAVIAVAHLGVTPALTVVQR